MRTKNDNMMVGGAYVPDAPKAFVQAKCFHNAHNLLGYVFRPEMKSCGLAPEIITRESILV